MVNLTYNMDTIGMNIHLNTKLKKQDKTIKTNKHCGCEVACPICLVTWNPMTVRLKAF